MSLILAIEPNKSQAHQLSALVRTYLKAELVTAATAAAGLSALGDRVPDLVLTPALLGLRDETALTERLRELGNAAAHIQTLAVPILSSASRGSGGLLSRKRDKGDTDHGCDPEVFADQIRVYLQRASLERRAQASEAAARVMTMVGSASPASSDTGLDDVSSFLVSADELDVEGLELSAPIPLPSAPVPPAAAPANVAPAQLPADEADPWRPALKGTDHQAPTRVEEELGLVTPPTAGPPLWRVTESIEEFYGDAAGFGPTEEAGPTSDEGAAATDAPAQTVRAAATVPSVSHEPRARRAPPQPDDFAYFDPSQSAFKALSRRLDEIAGNA